MTACTADDCTRPPRTRGMCPKHYARWQRHGDPNARVRTPQGEPANYLRTHLDSVTTDDCLIWSYYTAGRGYPVVWIDGVKRYVHHLACEHLHGPRPPGMEAAHGPCHNLRCFNPRHLSWKTPAENSGPDKVRDDTHTAGVRNSQARLTPDLVREIRARHAAGASMRSLAPNYGISPSGVRKIVRRLTWKEVQ